MTRITDQMTHDSAKIHRMSGCLFTIFAASLASCGGGQTGDVTAGDVTAQASTDATTQSLHRKFKVPVTRPGRVTSPDPVPTPALVGADPTPVALPAPAPAPSPAQSPAPAPPPVAPSIPGAPYIDVSKIPTGSLGVSIDMVAPTTDVPNDSTEGDFRTVCDFSHMSFDDPIVFPGQPGMSHLHAFFGNTGTNAASTSQAMHTTGNSTCRGGTINRSGYWQPAIIDTKDGTPVRPRIAIVYYKTGNGWIKPSTVQSLPDGLRMLSGDPRATAPSPYGAATFSCNGSAPPGRSTDLSNPYGPHSIPNCPAGGEVWASVVFPQCWDGVNLDSPDHRSHMAYSSPTCADPKYPVTLPLITITAVFPVTEAGAPLRWRLASDVYPATSPGGYSLHADWFNGWKPEVMDVWIKNCNQASKDCGASLLGDGRMMLMGAGYGG